MSGNPIQIYGCPKLGLSQIGFVKMPVLFLEVSG